MIPLLLLLALGVITLVLELLAGGFTAGSLVFLVALVLGALSWTGDAHSRQRAWLSTRWLRVLRWSVLGFAVTASYLFLTIQDRAALSSIDRVLGVLYAIWYIPLLGRAPFLFASASVWMDGNYLYVRRWLRTQIIPVDARVSVQAKGPFFSWVFGSSYPLPGLTIIPRYFKKFVRMEQILSQMTIGAMVGEKWELSWQGPDGSTQSVRFVHPERAAGEGAARDGLGALQEKLAKLRRTPER